MTHAHRRIHAHFLRHNLDVISAEAELKDGGHSERWIRQIGPESERISV